MSTKTLVYFLKRQRHDPLQYIISRDIKSYEELVKHCVSISLLPMSLEDYNTITKDIPLKKSDKNEKEIKLTGKSSQAQRKKRSRNSSKKISNT